jgi:anti-sigma28 factor (negative regulator of flagellin synthesis)
MNGIGEVGLFKTASAAPALDQQLRLARSSGEVAERNAATDVVELSPEAEIVADLSNEPDIRVDKVAEIRAQIESGQYDLRLSDKLATIVDRIIADL